MEGQRDGRFAAVSTSTVEALVLGLCALWTISVPCSSMHSTRFKNGIRRTMQRHIDHEVENLLTYGIQVKN